MANNRSYKVWLLCEVGYEHCTPIRAYSFKKVGLREVRRLTKKHEAEIKVMGPSGLPKWYTLTQIDLVTHDGAHVLHQSLIEAVGKNG